MTSAEVPTLPLPPKADPTKARRFEAGRAEALAALCSVLTSRPCGEPFLTVYLARFYHSLAVGLHYDEEFCRGEMLIKIVLNSSSLFRKDLQGINMLVPSFLSALELILPKVDVRQQLSCEVSLQDLRHSSISILLSLLSLPLHYLTHPLPDLNSVILNVHPSSSMSMLQDLPKDLDPSSSSSSLPSPPSQTFFALKDRVLQLLLGAIQHERDSTNMQMLLHGLMVVIQDIVTYENSVAQMIEAEVAAEEVEGNLACGDHVPLTATQSNASQHSLGRTLSLGSSSFTPPMLFKLAMEAAYQALREWEASVQVSLAALELMAGLVQLQIEDIDHNDSKHAMKLVCEYIEHQALKDRPQHNRDLHTSIVAAFRTLLVWLMAHPYLLGDKTCLTAVMNVIELGISGSSSTESDGSVIYKGDKASRPVSGRVRDMAEFVMAHVMEKVGSFPSPCGAEASSSLLYEDHLIPPDRKSDVHFRYFIVDNSLIMSLVEEPFPEEEASSPRVTVVLRSPGGRHVWTMKLRHQPRSEEPSTQHLHSMPRPSPCPHAPVLPSMERPPWPSEVEAEPQLRIDRSIPSLDDILTGNTRKQHSIMTELTIGQMAEEEKAHQAVSESLRRRPHPDPAIALEPPEVKQRFETARLVLSHLGLLGIQGVWAQSLAMLDSSNTVFRNHLSSLDHMPTRFCNSVFVLYFKEGLSKPEELLTSQLPLNNKPPEFIEFLHGLGWVVDPLSHPGFSGKIRPNKSDDVTKAVGIAAQIPVRPFPYYANAMTEVAFITPTLRPSSSDSSASLRSGESSDSAPDVTASLPVLPLSAGAQPQAPAQPDPLATLPPHFNLREPQGSGVCESTAQAEYSTYPGRGKQGQSGATRPEFAGADTPRRRSPIPQDCAALVVWLERFEDYHSFPLETLSGILHGGSFAGLGGSHKPQRRSLPTVFIHQLSSGLYQIVTKTPSSKQDLLAGPLIDGMVISRRVLSTLVRQTTINMCSRHRMENEGYSPPHIRRKRKIEEVSSSFARNLHAPEFYTKLFTEY